MNDRLVASIYSAGTEPELWPRVLNDVRAELGLVAVNLIVVDPMELRPPVMLESGHDPSAVALWHARAQEDPNLQAALAARGRLIWSDRIMERRRYERNAFVNEVMRPGGLWHVLGQALTTPEGVFGAGVHRPRNRPFVERDAARIAPVMHHLERALLVHHRVAAAFEDKRMLADVLDRLRAGALLLDVSGRLVLANRAAVALAAAGDGFALGTSMIGATPAITRELTLTAVRVAAGAGSASLSLRRPSGREPYRVLVVPLAAKDAASRPTTPRAVALALITDPEPPFLVAPDVLRRYFDFTAAEAKVAAALLAGRSTLEIAAALSVTINTVRVHVRKVLEKSGTSSRAELVARLATQLPETVIGN